jgi:xanthine dehydrogenase YagS FAD-binding subunit
VKRLTNTNARDLQHAIALAGDARRGGRAAAFAGGGSDLLGLVKDRVIAPDLIVRRAAVRNLDQATPSGGGLTLGGLMTLDAIGRHADLRRRYTVLPEAADTVATPQIRTVGTLAGNVCQRPWCWYFRNGFPCYKAGGSQCFSFAGENQFHAIFGAGPSYIVHPSDTAPALVALDAAFRIVGPGGDRRVGAAEFFVLPRRNTARENVLADDEVLASVQLPAPRPGMRSGYRKVMDREAWTHAVVSAAVVLDLAQGVCRGARIVLGGVAPIPWRVPDAEQVLVGQRITPELAARAGQIAVADARPLSKNAYKVPMTQAIVERTILDVADASV